MNHLNIDWETTEALFFDLEKTITPDAVEQKAAAYFHKRQKFPIKTVLYAAKGFLKYELGWIKDFEEVKRGGAMLFKGRNYRDDDLQYRIFFNQHLKGRIYPELREVIYTAKQKGIKVYIISSTWALFVRPYAEYLRVDDFFAVQHEVIDNIYTGEIEGTIIHQHTKASTVRDIAAQHNLNLNNCYAFGDSINDQLMLECVGNPIVINPSKQLKKWAKQNNTPILDFDKLK